MGVPHMPAVSVTHPGTVLPMERLPAAVQSAASVQLTAVRLPSPVLVEKVWIELHVPSVSVV